MKLIPTDIPDIRLIEPQIFTDPRGFFFESFNQGNYEKVGITARFVQDNHSRSQNNTLRGLHAQWRRPQGKLIRVILGEVFDVAVDIRRNSPTYKKWVGFTLSADNFRQCYIPPGFAHGFCVTSDEAIFAYKCTEGYHPAAELTIAHDDPALGIPWPVTGPTLSKKDMAGLRLADVPRERLPRYVG